MGTYISITYKRYSPFFRESNLEHYKKSYIFCITSIRSKTEVRDTEFGDSLCSDRVQLVDKHIAKIKRLIQMVVGGS